MKKKCKDCGGTYETDDQKLILMINHKDIENLEDLIFTKLIKEEYQKKRKIFHKIWKQICNGEEKWKK